MNNRDQWAELGLAIQYLYHDQHVNGQNDARGSMMMSGLPVDNQSRHWTLICSQAPEFPRAYIYPSQDIIKEIIEKQILYTDIPPHDKGQMWAVEYFQRIKVLLQNQISKSRDDICAMLRRAMIMPATRLTRNCRDRHPSNCKPKRKSTESVLRRRGNGSCH